MTLHSGVRDGLTDLVYQSIAIQNVFPPIYLKLMYPIPFHYVNTYNSQIKQCFFCQQQATYMPAALN